MSRNEETFCCWKSAQSHKTRVELFLCRKAPDIPLTASAVEGSKSRFRCRFLSRSRSRSRSRMRTRFLTSNHDRSRGRQQGRWQEGRGPMRQVPSRVQTSRLSTQ